MFALLALFAAPVIVADDTSVAINLTVDEVMYAYFGDGSDMADVVLEFDPQTGFKDPYSGTHADIDLTAKAYANENLAVTFTLTKPEGSSAPGTWTLSVYKDYGYGSGSWVVGNPSTHYQPLGEDERNYSIAVDIDIPLNTPAFVTTTAGTLVITFAGY